MRHPTQAGIGLVRLGESGFVPQNLEDDVRGKDVYDAEGQRLGSVEDLYIDRREREVRFLEVGAGGFLGIGEKRFLVPVEEVVKVAEGWVAIEPGRTKKVEGPAPFDTRVAPPPVAEDRRAEDYPRPLTATPVTPVAGATPPPRSRSTTDRSSRTVLMRATHRDARLPEASHDGRYPDAVWGVRGLMAEAILPHRPAERRLRRRLCAIRAMERLGLLGEEDLIATLARRPELRWLADEAGARWDVLSQLGRIGEAGTFEEAVAWALENRPSPEQAGDHVWRLRAGAAAVALEATKARRRPRHLRSTRNQPIEKGR